MLPLYLLSRVGKSLLLLGLLLALSTSRAWAQPTTYCTTNLGGAGCPASDLISAVSITGTTLNNTASSCLTTNGSSYATFPAAGSTTATLSPGTYTINVTSSSLSARGMWLDFNQDGIFDAGEFTRVTVAAGAGVAAAATFTVPATALPGLTKLRVRTNAPNGGGTSITGASACTLFASGQTQDYVVTIAGSPTCAAATAAMVGALAPTAASLTFTAAPGAVSYTVSYAPAGGPATSVTSGSSPVSLTGLTPGTAYAVSLVTNCAAGSSAAVALAFTTPAATGPANDDCLAAVPVPITLDCTAPTTGTVAGATQSLPAALNCGSAGPVVADVWYSFVATNAAHLISLTPQFDATLDVRTGSCAASASLYCGQTPANSNLSYTLSGLTVGSTYWLRVYPVGGMPTTPGFSLCVATLPAVPANDDCAAALPMPVAATCANPTAGTVAGATPSLLPTAGCGLGVLTAADVWYRFTATATTHIVTLEAQFTGILDVRAGSCAASTSFYCDSRGPGIPIQAPLRNLTVGTDYFIRVYSGAGVPLGTAAAFTVCVTTAAPNDEPCNAVALVNGVSATGTTYGATTTVQPGIQLPIAACAPGNPVPKDVWFTMTPPGATATISVRGAPAGFVRLYQSSGCATGFVLVDCRLLPTPVMQTLTFSNLAPGQLYYVAVAGGSNITPTGPFSIVVNGVLAAGPASSPDALAVYPTPASAGLLTLRFSTAHALGQATLVNGLGQVVRQYALPANATEHPLGVRGLAAGVYTLRVAVAGAVLTRRVLVE